MSYKHVQWALDADLRLRSAQKFVLVCIAERTNDLTLTSWPSCQDLVNRTGYSKRSVLQIIAELEEERIIEAVRKTGANNHYFLSGFIHSGDPGLPVYSLPTGDLGSRSGDLGSQSGDLGSPKPEKPEKTRRNAGVREQVTDDHRLPRVTTGELGHLSFKTFQPKPLKKSKPEIASAGLKSIREILKGVRHE